MMADKEMSTTQVMKMIPTKEEAQACSDRVAASKHWCGGCYGDFYCDISRKMAVANPVGAKLMQNIILMVATDGQKTSPAAS